MRRSGRAPERPPGREKDVIASQAAGAGRDQTLPARPRGTRRGARLALALALVLAALAPVLGDAAAPQAEAPAREYRIKAAFLYNFARFTEWPAASFDGTEAPLRFCVLGADPFGASLDAIAGKAVRGRTIVVSRVESAEAGATCHLLFISDSESERLARILAWLEARPILTIADMPGFAEAGGIIALETNSEDKVRFEINLATARRAGLRLSSRLLSLAEITPH